MSDLVPFDPARKSKRREVPHPTATSTVEKEGKEARHHLFDSLDEIKLLVEAGSVKLVCVTLAGPEGARHLIYDVDASLSDAAHTLLALRIASDQVVSQVMADACESCGGPLE